MNENGKACFAVEKTNKKKENHQKMTAATAD